VAFAAISDTGAHGVFLASPPAAPVPGLSPLGLALLAALLLLLAAAPRRVRAAPAACEGPR
jgi:hypothetical protein